MGSTAGPGAETRRLGARLQALAGPLLILLAALWMLRLTWRTWPDPIVDFGRELYVPWRLFEGEHLYADLAYYNGPLSPYLNALWFGWDGVALASLVHLNLAILALVAALLYRMLHQLAGAGPATLGGLTFIVLFAFGQFSGIGNYNWICPYSHEMTHGIALSLVAIGCVQGYARRGRAVFAAAAGVATGLVFLTKGEVFVAVWIASALGMSAALWIRRAPGPRVARDLAIWLAGLLAPVAIAIALLARAMPWRQAIEGGFSAGYHAFALRNLEQPFYQRIAGTDDLAASLGRLLLLALGSLAAIAIAAGVARLAARSRGSDGLWCGIAGVTCAVGFSALSPYFPWDDWLRPLPLWLGVLLAAAALALIRGIAGQRDAPRAVLRLSLLCFSALLLAKMAFNTRVGHYGFGLAMPGTVLLATFLVGPLTQRVSRWGGSPGVFATIVTVAWLGILLGHYGVVSEFVAEKSVIVGEGEDAFWSDPRGTALNEAIARLERNGDESDTLVTFVDCEMLNYQARRKSSVRYTKFIPQELLIFGEDAMRTALDQNPPDWIALVHADTSEYGPQFFGRDYAREMSDWIEHHYRRFGPPIGAVPMRGDAFGIEILRRRRSVGP